jgi:hypothetical protein
MAQPRKNTGTQTACTIDNGNLIIPFRALARCIGSRGNIEIPLPAMGPFGKQLQTWWNNRGEQTGARTPRTRSRAKARTASGAGE